MLGLILIYFIGKAFYDLASSHNKNEWLYAILGVVSYYVGTFIAGIIFYIVLDLFGINIAEFNTLALNFMALPIGLLTCWLFYLFLKKQFINSVSNLENDNILDDEFTN